jgi:hypothetical protein
MPLTGLAVDDGPHNMDGLLLHVQGRGSERGSIHKRTGHGLLGRSDRALRRSAKSAPHNATPLANSISRRSGELLSPNISAARRLTASIRSWMFCSPTSQTAKKRSIRVSWCASRDLPVSNEYRVSRGVVCEPARGLEEEAHHVI